MLTLAEFCTGTGGFSLAFQQTNEVQTVFSNDIEPSSKLLYDHNFDHKLVLKDIHNLDISTIPHVDIITSGIPCQPFSIAGKQLGFSEERSNVFFTLVKIINVIRPRCVLIENVKNLIGHDNGKSLKIILDALSEIGYYSTYTVLNTCTLTSIPQNRERIFIVCFRDKKHYNSFEFPNPDNPPVLQPLTDFLEEDVPEQYYYSSRFKIWDRIKDRITVPITQNQVYQYRRGVIRENKKNVCPTLTANLGMGGHNVPLIRDLNGIRKLTPRECFNLQGFPSDFDLPDTLSDSKLYKLAGNAISVPVVYLIAKNIVNTLTTQ